MSKCEVCKSDAHPSYFAVVMIALLLASFAFDGAIILPAYFDSLRFDKGTPFVAVYQLAGTPK